MISKENLEKSVRYEGFYRKGEQQYLASAVWDGSAFTELKTLIKPGSVPDKMAYYREGDPYFEPHFVFVGDPTKRGFV